MFTQETLQEAIAAVQEGKMTLRKAAQHYGVTKTTMIDRR
jgi:transposase-like protein